MAEGLNIEHLKPYGTYKPSGLDWLGDVPEHWVSAHGLAAFREKKVKNTGMQEKTVLSLSYGRIVVKPAEKLHGLVPGSFETYQIVDPGDIIIRSTDLQNDWNSKRVGLVQNRGIITSAYLCFKTTEKLRATYGYQLLNALDLMKVFYGMGSGLRQNLDFSDFKRMQVFLPPPDEQDAIVHFLGWATSRLDRAIRAKRKVIALLTEQKQAIIHRAVTRGLDPSVPLKPSGVSWLGDIPEHWDVVPSKALFKQRREKAREEDEMLTASQVHGIISRATFMEIEGRRVMQVITGAEILKHVEPNDFVMSMRSFEGGLEWSHARGSISSAYVMLVPTITVDPRYFSYALKSRYYISDLRRTSDLVRDGQALRYANFGQVPLPLIPIAEQQAIAEFLECSVTEIVRAVSRLEREIELLREYRTRLIADVVIGKLDVRKAALNLPDEASAEMAEEAGEDLSEGEFEEEEVEA